MKKLYILAAFTAMLLLNFASAQAQNCTAYFGYYTTPMGAISFQDSSMATVGNINSYAWDFGDGNTSTQQYPNHTYNTPGPFLVCLTITTTLGCTSTYCDSVGTGGSSPNCTTNLSASVSGSTASFTAPASGSGTPVSWFWDFGDGITTTTSTNSISHSYSSPGPNFNPCVTVLFTDSCTATSCTNVSLSGGSGCQAYFSHYPDTSSQYSIIVINNSSGNSISCSWDFGDGNTSTNCYPSHTYAGPGTYQLCLTINSGPACTDTYCDTITVTSKVNAPFSINIIPANPTAIEEPAADQLNFQLFPNPASTSVNFSADMTTAGTLEISLFDLQGKQVRNMVQNDLNSGTHKLQLETADLPAGIYMARVKAGEQVAVKKLLINK